MVNTGTLNIKINPITKTYEAYPVWKKFQGIEELDCLAQCLLCIQEEPDLILSTQEKSWYVEYVYDPAEVAELMSSRLKVGIYTKTEGCNIF